MVPEGMGPYQMVEESHNIYIQAAAELGMTGLFVFILLIVFAFVNNARTRTMSKSIDKPLLFNLSYGLDAGLIGFLVAGNFVTVLYYPFFWIQITMIVMVNSVAKRLYEDRMGPTGRNKRARTRRANFNRAQEREGEEYASDRVSVK